jgi:hypothetical protein
MPKGEGPQAASISSPGHPRAGTQVLPCARGPGRSSASLLGWPCVPVDHHGQVDKVGGSHPIMQHGGQHVRRQLGGTFWHAGHGWLQWTGVPSSPLPCGRVPAPA